MIHNNTIASFTSGGSTDNVPFDLALKWVNRMLESSNFVGNDHFVHPESEAQWKEFGVKGLRLVYDMLMERQKEGGNRGEWEDLVNRYKSDLNSCQLALTRTTAECATKERELGRIQAEHRSLSNQLSELRSKHQDLNQIVTKMKRDVALKQSQFIHELRKKDGIIGKFREMLSAGWRVELKKSGFGVHVTREAMYHGTGAGSGEGETGDVDDAAYGSVAERLANVTLNDYSERLFIMQQENDQLKECLAKLYLSAQSMFPTEYEGEGDNDVTSSDQEDPRFFQMSREQFELPLQWSRMEQKIDALCLHMEPLAIVDEKVNYMNDQISNYKSKIQEMSNIIERQNEFLCKSESVVMQEKQEKATKTSSMAAISDEAAKLEQDRVKFTEAALKLGRERAAFLAEKEAFEREKIKLSSAQMKQSQENAAAAMTEAISSDSFAMLDEETILNTPQWIRDKRSQSQSTNTKSTTTATANKQNPIIIKKNINSNNNNNPKSFIPNKKMDLVQPPTSKFESPFKSPLFDRYLRNDNDEEEGFEESKENFIMNYTANQDETSAWQQVDENETF